MPRAKQRPASREDSALAIEPQAAAAGKVQALEASPSDHGDASLAAGRAQRWQRRQQLQQEQEQHGQQQGQQQQEQQEQQEQQAAVSAAADASDNERAAIPDQGDASLPVGRAQRWQRRQQLQQEQEQHGQHQQGQQQQDQREAASVRAAASDDERAAIAGATAEAHASHQLQQLQPQQRPCSGCCCFPANNSQEGLHECLVCAQRQGLQQLQQQIVQFEQLLQSQQQHRQPQPPQQHQHQQQHQQQQPPQQQQSQQQPQAPPLQQQPPLPQPQPLQQLPQPKQQTHRQQTQLLHHQQLQWKQQQNTAQPLQVRWLPQLLRNQQLLQGDQPQPRHHLLQNQQQLSLCQQQPQQNRQLPQAQPLQQRDLHSKPLAQPTPQQQQQQQPREDQPEQQPHQTMQPLLQQTPQQQQQQKLQNQLMAAHKQQLQGQQELPPPKRHKAAEKPPPSAGNSSGHSSTITSSLAAEAAAAAPPPPPPPLTRRGSGSSSDNKAAPAAPAAYERIRKNQFVFRRGVALGPDEVPVCSCNPAAGQLCREDDGCLNRLLKVSCSPGHCPAGAACCNMVLVNKKGPRLKLAPTGGKGWGIIACEPIPAGAFVAEYTGEVVPVAEGSRRLLQYAAEGLKHTYIMDLSRSEVIDATRKGSLARFINHSCDPNCETQKWQVGGELCIAIVAARAIPAGTEVTYNYRYESADLPRSRTRCRCGAAACSGWLGGLDAAAHLAVQLRELEADHEARVVRQVDEVTGEEFVVDVLDPLDSDEPDA